MIYYIIRENKNEFFNKEIDEAYIDLKEKKQKKYEFLCCEMRK